MVNTEDFIKRLEELLEYYSLTASGFADKINVQRSSLSHLLSGRNKPSLDFILKVTTAFEDVTFDWLLKGNGNFPKDQNNAANPTPTNLFGSHGVNSSENKKIQRIVVFFEDGTFDEYLK